MGITKSTSCTITVDRTEAIDDVRVDGSIHKSELLGCFLDDMAHKPKYVCNTLVVSSGGTVKDVIVMSGGQIRVEDGNVDKVEVATGGYLNVLGGTVTNISECGGCISSAGWKSCHLEISRVKHHAYKLSGTVSIHDGNTFESGYINGAMVTIFSGGKLSDYTLGRGRVTITSGGLCHNVNVSHGGMIVGDGGSATNIVISSGGIIELIVHEGVPSTKMQDIVVSGGGSVFVDEYEKDTDTDISSLTLTDGAVVYFTTFDKEGEELGTNAYVQHDGALIPEHEYQQIINSSSKEEE